MSATVAVGRDGGGTARRVLAVYPSRWRDTYGSEMLETLRDVADATPSGRVPSRELIGLALRGAIMRARTSMTFWAAVPVVGVFVWLSLAGFTYFSPTGAWNDLFIQSGLGLQLALPIAAVVAAIRAHRATRSVDVDIRSRLVGMVRTVWPLLAVLLVGWVSALALNISHVGIPPLWDGDVRILLAQAAMSVGTIAVGYAVGSVVHPVLAVPQLLIAVGWWFQTPTWLGNDPLRWSNVTGFNLFTYTTGLGGSVVQQALLVVPLGSLLAVALSVAVVVVRRQWLRRLTALGIVAVLITAGVLFSHGLLHYVGGNITTDRSPSALVCDGSAPKICLWPEQEQLASATSGEATLRAEYARAVDAGLIIPSTISAGAMLQAPVKSGGPTAFVWYQGISASGLADSYANSLADGSACFATASGKDSQAAEYGTALLLGVPESAALPDIETRALSATSDVRESRTQTLASMGMHSDRQAMAFARSWNAGECRA